MVIFGILKIITLSITQRISNIDYVTIALIFATIAIVALIILIIKEFTENEV